MAKHWIPESDFERRPFIEWLRQQGAVIQKPTDEFQLVRYRIGAELFIIYAKPSKRRVTFQDRQWEHWQKYLLKQNLTRRELEKIKPDRPPDFFLYCDASLHIRTHAASWAAILVGGPDGEREAHGPLRGKIKSSNAAEMMAIANGLHEFIRLGKIPPKSLVEVVCDNQPAVNYIHRRKCAPSGKSAAQIVEAFEYITTIARRAGIYLDAKWIRGHQDSNSKNPRVIFNRRCDALAAQHSQSLHEERLLARA